MAYSGKPCRQSANLTPVPCSSTSKRSPLASTNLVCISGIQHIDLIRQYRGAGIDLLINGDRNDVETVYFSPRMSCPTLPDGRCRKTAGGGDHVDWRCAWGAKRNRAYLPRLPALTRRALSDFAEPNLSRIRIAGNKAASSRSLTSAAGRLRLPLPKTRGIERAPRGHSPTGDRREKRLFRHF